jgi:hypothetical protein
MTRESNMDVRSMIEGDSRDRGAAAITVTICLVLLMGFAALAIDGGLGFDDRRGTQNAADNAALAAAWEACNPSTTPPDPEGSALSVAAQNGYDNDDPETTVTVTELDTAVYEVVIGTLNDTTFGGPGAGADSVAVNSRAVASCEQEPFLGGYAIFAGAESCPNGGAVELDLSGSSKTIDGGIFSNGDLNLLGPPPKTSITGPIEYRGVFNSNSGVSGEQYFGSPKDYPLDLEISDFRPGGAYSSDPNYVNAMGATIDNAWMVDNGYAVGDNASIEIIKSGIYYTSDSGNDAIDLARISPGVDPSTGDLATVTFVSEGSMHITGNAADVTGYAPITSGSSSPVLFFSNAGSPPDCNIIAIQFSGSNMTWTGLIYAPNGSVVMSSSSSSANIDGSIFAFTVNVSGSDLTITWQDDPTAEPRFIVELDE